MGELLRSNDPVLISYAMSLLVEAGIAHHLADRYMSVLEGSVGALARRILVPLEDLPRARTLMEMAGLGAELSPSDPAHG
jgi:Putative prokaryotic signal transducing protein